MTNTRSFQIVTVTVLMHTVVSFVPIPGGWTKNNNIININNNNVQHLSTFDRRNVQLSLFFSGERSDDSNNMKKETTTSSSSSSSSSTSSQNQRLDLQRNQQSNNNNNNNNKYSQIEFKDLEPLPENDTRRKRIEQELEIKAQFAEFGDTLWELRAEMDTLSHQLLSAIEGGHDDLEEQTREKLREVERRDPELVYKIIIADYERAVKEGRIEDSKVLNQRAIQTRSCLPQFNLDGLWVGKYGTRYELINITYVGDVLIAEKVTGDENVPKGEVTFQVDLSPGKLKKIKSSLSSSSSSSKNSNIGEILQPIQLTDKAAKKWGTKKLPRYAGLGQVAERGFRNTQWLDGQLILIGDAYFSFAWLPIEQQIFFGRPSPELALKMIRESSTVPKYFSPTTPFIVPPSIDSNVDLLKEYITRCMDKTNEVEDEMDTDGIFGGCILQDGEGNCFFE